MGVTLTEFLVLQIATDEGLRNEVHLGECLIWDPVRSRCDCLGPERVTAECEAKRRIVELHAIDCWVGTGPDGDDEYFCAGCAGAGTASTPDGVVCPTLAALATVYGDRPGYLDEWRRP
jgi:hypothetical protein